MTRATMVLTVALLAAAGCGGGSQQPPAGKGAATTGSGPRVPVKTTAAAMTEIADMRTVYGAVTADPGGVHMVVVPYESRVQSIDVVPGQQVRSGEPVLTVAPSASAAMQLRQAENDLAMAKQGLQQVEQRVHDQLATRSDLLQARNNLQSARARVEGLHARGVGGVRRLGAPASGVVRSIAVHPGEVAAAGTALLEIVPTDALEARLGVPPADAGALSSGQSVPIAPVGSQKPAATGTIRSIANDVDPATRLVPIRVALPDGAALPLDSFVQGTVTLARHQGLVVPRAALVADGGKYFVYTVHDGHAVRHRVSLGIESGQQVELIGSHLQAGDAVVVEGSSELSDGTAVSESGPS